MMKFASSLIQSPDGRSHWIDPEGEFLQAIQRRLVELSQPIQNLQTSGQAETFERVHPTFVALTLHPSPKLGRGTLNLAPLLPILGEEVGGCRALLFSQSGPNCKTGMHPV